MDAHDLSVQFSLCLKRFRKEKKNPICCVENGSKNRKWESMQETVAEAQVRDAGGLDQGGVPGKGRSEQIERDLGDLTVHGDWLLYRLGEGGIKSPIL